MTRYEHKVADLDKLLAAQERWPEVNKFGGEGWRIVGVTTVGNFPQVIMERKIR
jgi:hypothetical protein